MNTIILKIKGKCCGCIASVNIYPANALTPITNDKDFQLIKLIKDKYI